MPSADRLRPIISQTFDDHTIIELIFDPVAGSTALAVCHPDGSTSVHETVELPSGERVGPYPPSNNIIANGCVLLPSTTGGFLDKATPLARVREFIHPYVDLPDPFKAIAPPSGP